MPATGFLVADLLCLVTHGILKADMFEAGGRFWDAVATAVFALRDKRSLLPPVGPPARVRGVRVR